MNKRPIGKIRQPLTVLLLAFITLGVYWIVYQYSLFEELKNHRGQGWSGGVYLLFLFLLPPAIIAVPWLVPAYIGRLYAEDGQEKPITGLAGWWVFLPFIGGLVWLFKVQENLNTFWATKGAVA